jgi:hypothetical protein
LVAVLLLGLFSAAIRLQRFTRTRDRPSRWAVIAAIGLLALEVIRWASWHVTDQILAIGTNNAQLGIVLEFVGAITIALAAARHGHPIPGDDRADPEDSTREGRE